MSETSRIGKYEILEELGRGGFAVVYKARDVTLNRIVALKVLFPHLTSDPKFVQRFQQEAQTAAQFHHPHIVTIHEVGQEKGSYYLVMTYLEGRTLDRVIAEGSLTPEQTVAILEQIAEALDLIHSHGLVHRDIKPANIMIGEDGQATLLDFGIVRAVEGTQLTTTMAAIGTPEYMSPEQAKGNESTGIDWRADLYALSVVAYEMLVGKPPFSDSSPTAVLHKHVYEAPPRPTALNSALLPGVEPVLLKGLAKKREERFQKASDFAQQLRQAVLPPSPPPPLSAPPNVPLWLIIIVLLIGSVGFTALAGFSQGWWKPATPTPTPTATPSPISTAIPASTSIPVPILTSTLIPTPTVAYFDLIGSSYTLSPISTHNSKITAAMVEGKLEIAFTNGQGDQEYTGVVFKYARALDVQPFTHIDISGTATKEFKLRIEYKDAGAVIVRYSDYYLFPASTKVSTIMIPLTYTDTIPIHEIAFMFHDKSAASTMTIESIRLSP